VQLDLSAGTAQVQLGDGVSLSFDFSRPEVAGLTAVTVAGVPLRDGSYPLAPAIATETGLVFESYRLQDARVEGDQVVLVAQATARVDYYQEKPDAYNQEISTELRKAPVTGTLRWYLQPHAVTVRGEEFLGFGYRFEFDSPEVVVHHLLDRQTWEIGGAAAGNTTINRGGYIKPEHTATVDSRHTTSEEFKRVGKRFFSFMQLRPRFAYVQCFDFQTGPPGSLLMYFEDPTFIMSLLHKERGRNLFQYFDDHWQAAGQALGTTWRYVVFHATPEAQDLWAGRNRWLGCWDFCAGHYRDKAGMTEGSPECGLSLGYWTRDMERYNRFIDNVSTLLPRMEELGFKYWWLPMMNDCNMTADVQIVANMITSHNPCCPRDFRFAESVGGDARVRELVAQAEQSHLSVMHWVAGHLAIECPTSPLLAEHSDWGAIGNAGLPYCPATRVATSGDFNGPYGERFAANLEHWIRDLGLKDLFVDSYPNFMMMVVNYADEQLRPQQDAVLAIQKRCNDLGSQWYVEGESPFGISSNGLAGPILGLGGGESERVQNLHHDNWTLDNFTGERQYVLYKTSLRTDLADLKAGKIPLDLFYRLIAFKAPLGLGYELKDPMSEYMPDLGVTDEQIPEYALTLLDEFPLEFAELMHLYDRVRPLLGWGEMLPDYAGSLWESYDGKSRVVFGFEPTPVALRAGETVRREHGDTPPQVTDGVLAVQPGHVYVLEA
jgi:hypothetical protein